MINSWLRRLAIPAALPVALLASWSAEPHAAPEQAKALSEEQREVDELLGKADNVELRKVSPRVLRLADSLLKERGDVEAQRYFEKGLEGNSWALEHQLTLGEILARRGQANALREKAEMVLRIGEEDEVLRRASRLIDRAVPEAPKPISEVKEPNTVLILVPVGTVSIRVLRELRDVLAKRLGTKVVLASVDLQIPKADRTAKDQWVTRTRERVLNTIREQPGLTRQLLPMGFTVEQLRTKDESLVSLIRKTTEQESGVAAVQALDTMLGQLENTQQWDATKVIALLKSAAGDRAGARQLVLGITPCDLFSGGSNFLFGAGATGQFLGVVSVHRFRAVFNGEPPKRERLIERLLKQSLSTIGFTIGVPRCATPECARAYPQSLAEHDQKPSTLCPKCRAGFEQALGQNLPDD